MIHYYSFIIHYSLPVDNPVDNCGKTLVQLYAYPHALAEMPRTEDFHSLLQAMKQSFPRFCTEKRYKLITFAQ